MLRFLVKQFKKAALGARLADALEERNGHVRPAPPAPARTGVAPPLGRVEAVAGPHAGEVFPLRQGAIVGRAAEAQISLCRDNSVSRRHARIIEEEGQWLIQDGKSTNGLYVNGERVAEHWLRSGDRVTMGVTTLVIT
ncbi:MAG: FHA domain-containing protein [Armatimonadetes bacterium]|nr:FHA domain-containing protein [Armatimonadota bacterium]MDE2206557.1 FHA domain-containing protein [Armatimonadota bacterium]